MVSVLKNLKRSVFTYNKIFKVQLFDMVTEFIYSIYLLLYIETYSINQSHSETFCVETVQKHVQVDWTL